MKSLKEIIKKIDKPFIIKTCHDSIEYVKNYDLLRLSYVPFIGWYVPMIMKRDDEFYMYHAKQGFVLAVYFAGTCTALFVSTVFLSVHSYIIKFIIVMIIYIHYIVYFVLCILGTRMILDKKQEDFPYIQKYIAIYTSRLGI